MTHRAERVADQIRMVLSAAIRDEIRDPRVGFATLTEVELSPDLKQARVFVSRLGSPAEREASVVALNHAAPFLRKVLAERARLRYTPVLRFVSDDTLERGSRVEEIIRDLHAGDPPEPDSGS
ncbi:MAG TPA: 30S ribosome-binding factor RbfA [Candidatus Sulfotelmatobacter sp.]|jgi:ribosome-binding factor A|nr:30S ribosome-binding factor RbfA [Candidatus Sulfotelmatobacter sp.]